MCDDLLGAPDILGRGFVLVFEFLRKKYEFYLDILFWKHLTMWYYSENHIKIKKVLFNIASQASYIYKLSGQKFIKKRPSKFYNCPFCLISCIKQSISASKGGSSSCNIGGVAKYLLLGLGLFFKELAMALLMLDGTEFLLLEFGWGWGLTIVPFLSDDL